MDPVGLDKLLASLPQVNNPNLLVGYAGSDDAGIYRLDNETALVLTADFITPPVDDPYLFGQIAAANALGDVYAMGAKPIACLNLVAFPAKKLRPDVLQRIVAGALSKITEAGAVLAGGHSIEDDEPKFGLAVTGIVHPQKYWSNSTSRPGDVLILTKPVGSGVLFNANLKKWVSARAMAECITVITTLNKRAAEVMTDYSVHAATDVTGFGLAGHSFEMARGSKTRFEIEIEKIPIMTDALAMYEKGMTTGVNRSNRELVENHLHFSRKLPAWHEEIVFDPQTSGGLLLAVPESIGNQVITALRRAGVSHAAIIGKVRPSNDSIFLSFL
ncbi:MAG: selenide, water dikinase SelD [Desulfobacterales bacterium]|nr:selenide, water dikinase SelD [Desulfobacterales bacterium]